MTAEQVPGEIRTVLIPMHDTTLLLPNAAVAEVIDYRLPKNINGSPDWLSGSVSWRQISLPVIVMENMLGHQVDKPGVRQRIAVCHAQIPGARFPYIGIVAQGIPRLVRLSENLIELVEAAENDGEVPVYGKVLVDGEAAWIPDLKKVEVLLNEALQA